MTKKRGLIKIGITILIFSLLNVYFFVNKGGASYSSISGKIVTEMPELPLGLNFSLVAFIVQWLILLLIVFVSYAQFLKHQKQEHIKISHSRLIQKKSKSETDLDVLYQLIKDKKRVSTGVISKLFKITKERALEWSKILENHKLVTIEYPTFNDPEVKLYEEENKEKEQENKEKEQENKEQKNKPKAKKEKKRKKKPLKKEKRIQKRKK